MFCNQKKISGTLETPSTSEVNSIIEQYLSTIPTESHIEIAFFGGNFTGIDKSLQIEYLSAAYKYIEKGVIESIRLSTRPDYISEEILQTLKRYKVKTIELGAAIHVR